MALAPEVIDVDEIKVLAVDEEASDKNMPIVKLESTTCIVSPPMEASRAFHQLSWCVCSMLPIAHQVSWY